VIKDKHILITGDRGYLGGALKSALSQHNTILCVDRDVRDCVSIDHDHVDVVLHFASPIDNTDVSRTASSIITGTMNMLNICKQYDAKFVFASTMGVYGHETDDVYCSCKLAMENYITSLYNNYIILRIPRVYSECRNKGLIKLIKDDNINQQDMHKIIDFITLRDFVDQTLPVLEQKNYIHEYNITHHESIKQIVSWVKK